MTADDTAPRPSSPAAQENIRAVARLQERVSKRRTIAERVSDYIAALASREATVLAHLLFFAVWIGVNIGILPIRPFDPFPFSLLTSLVSLEAIFLTLFVLASQKRLTEDADRRAHLDLQVNLLAEQEMTLVLQMLREVCDHLELRQTIDSERFQDLVKRTDVGELAEHLEQTIGPAGASKEQSPPR